MVGMQGLIGELRGVEERLRRALWGSYMPENSAGEFGLTALYQEQFQVIHAVSPKILDRIYRLRFQIYCVENRFEDPADNPNGRERDANDDRAAHLLLLHRESGEAAGTARVILPELEDRPLPIEEVLDTDGRQSFRDLPPGSTGEISRFAVSRVFRRHQLQEFRFPPGTMRFITFGLFRGILEICLERRITHVTAIMEPALLRLLSRFGLNFHAIGGLVEYHGLRQPCVARLQELIDNVRQGCQPLWLYAGSGTPTAAAAQGISIPSLASR